MSRSERVTFTGHDGAELAARLDYPVYPPSAVVLFAHCFSCSKDLLVASRLARRMVDHGLAVLRFDFTGLGASEGEFANTNFSSNVEDLIAASAWLTGRFGSTDLLIGHSLGGAASVVAASRMPSIKAVATIGTPSDASHVLDQFGEHLDTICEKGQAQVNLAGRPFVIKKQFVDDVQDAKVIEAVSKLRRPLLVMHSPTDEVVGIDNATKLYSAARHPKSFVSLDNADHLLSREEDVVFAADVISAWAKRYLAKPEDKPREPTEPVKGFQVRVEETGTGNYANHVVTPAHVLRTDEPGGLGGMNTGPGPFDYLCAALGACTSITVRMYADRKGWPLENVRVDVTHKKETQEPGSDRKANVFLRQISFFGDLDEEQRQRLLVIADKCPVHKTLHAGSEIQTELVSAS